MDTLSKIAERRIQEALEKGKLDDLPGQGKPIVFEDDRGVPEDLRLAYKILKNTGITPPEVELRNRIATTKELLAGLEDEQEKLEAIKRLNVLMLKLNMGRQCPITIDDDSDYYAKVVERLGRKKQK